MTILMLLHYSEQPWYIDVLDFVLATLFTTLMFLRDLRRYKKIEEDFLQPLEVPAHERNASGNIKFHFRAREVIQISLKLYKRQGFFKN